MWTKNTEKLFFKKTEKIATKEQIFYKTEDNKYLTYWPNKYKGQKTTLQSRNTLIGNYTENWTVNLLKKVLKDERYYTLQNVQCDKIGLTYRSPADIV